MAQSSSVQREPSMEEILASIRRIIEDNETSRKDDKVVPQASSYRSRPDAGEDTHDDEPQSHAAEGRAPQQDFSRVEAEPADPVAHEPVLVEAPAADSNATVSIQQADTPDVAQPERIVQAQDVASASFSPTSGHSAPDSIVPEPSFSDLNIPILNIVEQHVADVIKANDEDELTPAIVSEQSGRKVAASFNELSDAYQASRRKSLADAAEEMLRPMLREWLDDNLPQLVEKLVREEIERIARGS